MILGKNKYGREDYINAMWKARIQEVTDFYSEYSRLPNSKESALGQWVGTVRREYNLHKDEFDIDENKVEELNSLGFWDWETEKDRKWLNRFKELKLWVESHEGQYPSEHNEDDFTFDVRGWLSHIRDDKKQNRVNKVTPERASLLESLPNWKWTLKTAGRRSFIERELLWRVKSGIKEPARVATIKGTKIWPCDIVIHSKKIVIEYDGWFWHKDTEEKDRRKSKELTDLGWTVIRVREKPLPKLEKIDISYDTKESISILEKELIDLLVKYGCSRKEKSWQHLDMKQGSFRTAYDEWHEGYERLLSYLDTKGTAVVPKSFICEDEFKLGQWVHVQRRALKRGHLSDAKVSLLNQIPTWKWELVDTVQVGWEAAYQRTITFTHKNGRMPEAKYRSPEDNFALGKWVSYQRGDYRKGILSKERIDKLELIENWWWDKSKAK